MTAPLRTPLTETPVLAARMSAPEAPASWLQGFEMGVNCAQTEPEIIRRAVAEMAHGADLMAVSDGLTPEDARAQHEINVQELITALRRVAVR